MGDKTCGECLASQSVVKRGSSKGDGPCDKTLSAGRGGRRKEVTGVSGEAENDPKKILEGTQ